MKKIILQTIKDYGLIIPLLLAAASYFIATIFSLKLSSGNIQLAIYLAQEVGVVNLWQQGVFFILIVIYACTASLLLAIALTRLKTNKIHAATIALSIFFTLAMTLSLLFLVVIICASILFTFELSKLNERREKKIDEAMNEKEMKLISKQRMESRTAQHARDKKFLKHVSSSFLAVLSITLLLVISSYPLNLHVTVEDKHNNTTVGKILSQDSTKLIIQDKSTSKISQIHQSEVSRIEICEGDALAILNYSILKLLQDQVLNQHCDI